MESPYTSPTAWKLDYDRVVRSKKFLVRAAFVTGLCVALPPLIGLAGVIKGMVGAFSNLRKSGYADPSALAGDISIALLSTFWGLMFSALFLIPFLVFLVLYFRRKKLLHHLSVQSTFQNSSIGASAESDQQPEIEN